MPTLEISLLGPLRVLVAGQTLRKFKTTKIQALLAYLVVEAEQAHSRDKLAALLWPEQPEPRARLNLRQSLHRLRRIIPAAFVIADRKTIQFNPESSYSLDVTSFTTLIDACHRHAHVEMSLCQPCLTRLQQATALYQGDFLAHFFLADSPDFEEWALLKREWLRGEVLQALYQLSAYNEQHEQFDQAYQYAWQQIELDPLREEAYRQLMLVQARTGHRSAALAQYETCREILAAEMGVEPSAETTALYQRILGEELEQGAEKLSRHRQTQGSDWVQDWADVPRFDYFLGRQKELAELKQWLVDDRCRLVSILGMGGLGKTALAAKLVETLSGPTAAGSSGGSDQAAFPVEERISGPLFERIIWQSLRNAPPLANILGGWIQYLSYQQVVDLPRSLDDQLVLLFDYLRTQRCLIILDNVESILQSGERAGDYRPGFEDYQLLIQHAAEYNHQSCLLFTSRERPQGMARLERASRQARSYHLSGLPAEMAQEILRFRGLTAQEQLSSALGQRYSGNPLALHLVTDTIQDLFAGDVNLFLNEETPVFGDIRDVLDQQFNRLSPLELDTIFWLAIEREPVSAHALWNNFAAKGAWRVFLDALRSLQRRSLLERSSKDPGVGFALQNVVLEYATERVIEAVCQEIERLSDPGSGSSPTRITNTILNSHALIKAQAKDFVRESQTRLILQPIIEQLRNRLGREGIEVALQHVLTELRTLFPPPPGYAGGNILNLLVHLGTDLDGYDLSRLTIRQAYLHGVALPHVNFSQSNLSQSVFSDTFDSIISVAVSPDGKLLAAGTIDSKIRLWRTADSRPCAIYEGHTGPVWSLAFSPDGQTLASGSGDETIRLWDLTDTLTSDDPKLVNRGQTHHILRGHTNWVWSVVFSPDGEMLISGSSDQTIRFWDAHAGQARHTLHSEDSSITHVAISPDGKTLASSVGDQTIRLWDLAGVLNPDDAETGAPERPYQILRGHTGFTASIAFSPDGQLLASGSHDQTVRLWAPQTGQLLHTFHGHTNRVVSLAFSPDNKMLASGSGDQTIRLWDINRDAESKTDQTLHVLRGHTNLVDCLAFTPDGQMLISGSYDQTIRFWDMANPKALDSGQPVRTLHGHHNQVLCIAFSPDGKTLASGSYDRTIRLWDLADTKSLDRGQSLRTLRGHDNWVASLVFSPDGKTLASSGYDQTIRLWDISSGRHRRTLHGHKNWVLSVSFSPDGQTLASGSLDQTVRLWDPHSGALRHNLRGDHNIVWSVAFSPDGHTLASGGYGQTIRLWDVQSGQSRTVLRGHTSIVWSVAFSPDGHTLASGSLDQTIRLWDPHSGQLRHTLQGHENPVECVAFSPDGQTLASGSYDQTIRLWDPDSGKLRQVLHGHTHVVECVVFSPDGQTLASSSGDETVRLWDAKTGKQLRTIRTAGPYAGMNISGVTGLAAVEKAVLLDLGAVEHEE